ncbi:MAG: uracil phosphoribosyltransferase [Bacteroidaceae bacterium]|nr:uracil phosphoribosyltransferase [Bacteroidaceae bacterium]
MKVINLSAKNTILNKYLAEIRDVNLQKERMRFRQNIIRIGHVEAYEASRYLDYAEKEVQTPLDKCDVSVPQNDIVVGTVFRAGLPLHQAFLDVFDDADNAFVSAYRYYLDKECTKVGVKIEYMATPVLDGKTLILVDPMLATGESMELAYKAFQTNGTPKQIIMACVIASKQGVEHLRKCFPNDNATLICGAIDPVLNERKYIVPGLGDAGDLMYGAKETKKE